MKGLLQKGHRARFQKRDSTSSYCVTPEEKGAVGGSLTS